jgi:glycine oxidase
VKHWDVIVIGGGIIGLSLALALKKRGTNVLVVERGEPAREASHAAGGMLADTPFEIPEALHELAGASARMYPAFAEELEADSGISVDLRRHGSIFLSDSSLSANGHDLPASLAELEPALVTRKPHALFLKEGSVDPRALSEAALKAAKHHGVEIVSGTAVKRVLVEAGKINGVETDRTSYIAPKVVNCAGAWSRQIGPFLFPTRPVKGQMLALIAPRETVRHVIRSSDVYLIPRSDGRIVVGSTLEEAGFDKRTDPGTIRGLYQAAVRHVPKLAEAKILEDWAGLRPGTPDKLPLLGRTELRGYFVATGHFRDGILLAPITAQVMASVIMEERPAYDLSAFSPARFEGVRTGAAD